MRSSIAGHRPSFTRQTPRFQTPTVGPLLPPFSLPSEQRDSVSLARRLWNQAPAECRVFSCAFVGGASVRAGRPRAVCQGHPSALSQPPNQPTNEQRTERTNRTNERTNQPNQRTNHPQPTKQTTPPATHSTCHLPHPRSNLLLSLSLSPTVVSLSGVRVGPEPQLRVSRTQHSWWTTHSSSSSSNNNTQEAL